MAGIIQVNDKSFDHEVIESPIPVLVDFWAPWCGPCKMVGPLLEELAREYEGRVKVVKLDTQESTQVAALLGIKSIPTVALFDGHNVVDVAVGARPKVGYARMLEGYLKKWDKKRAKEAKRAEKEAARAASEQPRDQVVV
jgi:thioredoxin 1